MNVRSVGLRNEMRKQKSFLSYKKSFLPYSSKKKSVTFEAVKIGELPLKRNARDDRVYSSTLTSSIFNLQAQVAVDE